MHYRGSVTNKNNRHCNKNNINTMDLDGEVRFPFNFLFITLGRTWQTDGRHNRLKLVINYCLKLWA